MRHARKDYNRIQDPEGLIPEDEPVFLLRAQDKAAPETVEVWARFAEEIGADPSMVTAAFKQAREMKKWQREHRCKVPDLPDGQ